MPCLVTCISPSITEVSTGSWAAVQCSLYSLFLQEWAVVCRKQPKDKYIYLSRHLLPLSPLRMARSSGSLVAEQPILSRSSTRNLYCLFGLPRQDGAVLHRESVVQCGRSHGLSWWQSEDATPLQARRRLRVGPDRRTCCSYLDGTETADLGAKYTPHREHVGGRVELRRRERMYLVVRLVG